MAKRKRKRIKAEYQQTAWTPSTPPDPSPGEGTIFTPQGEVQSAPEPKTLERMCTDAQEAAVSSRQQMGKLIEAVLAQMRREAGLLEAAAKLLKSV